MSKPKLLLTIGLPASVMTRLSSVCDVTSVTSRADLLSSLPGHRVLLCSSFDNVDRELLAAGDCLEAVVTVSAGYNHVDTQEMARRGLLLGNTPGEETTLTLTILTMSSQMC